MKAHEWTRRFRLPVVAAVLAASAGGVFYYLRSFDEALAPTPGKLTEMREAADFAQTRTDEFREYPLPVELIRALDQAQEFRVFHRVADIPGAVKSAFAEAAHEERFSMADPNGRWNATDVIGWDRLPQRRLVSLALGGTWCLLFYERGGIGKSDDVAAFRMVKDSADPIWHAHLAPGVSNPTALAKAIQGKNYYESPYF